LLIVAFVVGTDKKVLRNHIEVPVKVNAWVDKGVMPLVSALNEFKEVWTTDSCEGKGDFAYVHFAYCGSAQEFFKFVQKLSTKLGSKIVSDNEYRFTLEWVAGSERPLGTLVAHRGIVASLSNAIRQLAFSCDHRNQSQHGTDGTELHSSRGHRVLQRSEQ